MSATRTLVDLARFVSPEQLTAALDSALRDGRTSEDLLHRRIASLRSSGRYGIPQLLAVIEGCEASRGGHSWLERRFLELCAHAGLPKPLTQQVMSRAQDRLVHVDCRCAGTPVVVELLGYRWHRSAEQMSPRRGAPERARPGGPAADPVHVPAGHGGTGVGGGPGSLRPASGGRVKQSASYVSPRPPTRCPWPGRSRSPARRCPVPTCRVRAPPRTRGTARGRPRGPRGAAGRRPVGAR